jgi:hypothetical protein
MPAIVENERKDAKLWNCYMRRYRLKNGDKVRGIERNYYQKNKIRISRKKNSGQDMLKEEFEKAMLALEVDGGCEICGKVGERVIDHNHKTKKFRGLLCRNCNTALGNFCDNIDVIEKAIMYLKKDAS